MFHQHSSLKIGKKWVKGVLVCKPFAVMMYIPYLNICVWKTITTTDKGAVQKHIHSFSLTGPSFTCGTSAGLNR